jgi:hypothetical protein
VNQLKRELRRKDEALAETAALLALQKRCMQFGGGRGRMIGALDRKRAVRLIKETTDAGERTASACRETGISMRTFQRWTLEGEVRTDGRPDADCPAPKNKLTPQERQAVLDPVNSTAYRSLPPGQIVPALADEGRYIASESTFYRILREEGQQQHRGRSRTR